MLLLMFVPSGKKHIRMKTKIIILLTLLSMCFSCSKDFLEVEKRGLIAQEDFYQTDDEALQAIAAIYDILQMNYSSVWHSGWFLKTLPGDEVNGGGGNAGDQPQIQALSSFEYTPSNDVIYQFFRRCYFGIYRANVLLENVEGDTDAKKIALAEAKALRAFFNFELVTLFGEVPLVNEVIADATQYAQPAAEISAIWAQIETDLNAAIVDLPLKSEYPAAQKFRFAKGTAQALLGKALLYQEKYAAAAEQFADVIESAEYDLAPDFSRVLRADTEFGTESLLEISFAMDDGQNWGTFDWGDPRANENNIIWQLCGPRGDGYFEGGNSGLNNGWGFAPATTDIFDAFTQDGVVDNRRASSVMSEEELIALGGDLRLNGELAYDTEGVVRLKYGTWLDETDVSNVAELNYGTNIRLIRYADVLLMAAEAYNKSGDDASALIELNKVRARVNMPDIDAADDVFEAIVRERQLELAFEGHRFLDLIRWGKAAEVLGSRGYEAKHRYFPLPQLELDINPNLEQNPDW